MLKKIIMSIFVLIFTGLVGLFSYALTSQNIEQLLVCTSSAYVPVNLICREYLLNFRGTPADIDLLHKGVGASFVFNSDLDFQEEKEILEYLITKGLDINHLDMHRSFPLHNAVLINSVEAIKFLLNHGADPTLKDEKHGLSAREFVLMLDEKTKGQIDHSAIINILKNAN